MRPKRIEPPHTLDSPIEPRAAGSAVPLTAGQRLLWEHCMRQDPPLSIRTCAAAHRILGALDARLLRRCLELVVQRHESLRTRIVTVDNVPRQRVDGTWGGCLAVIDLSDFPHSEAEERVRRLAQEFVDERIDLSGGPLFAACLWRLSSSDHVLILALDHIVSDGFSFGILSREVWTLYQQGVSGSALWLPPLAVQFPDYALWQYLTYEDWSKKHEAYWCERLADASCAHIPPDNDPPAARAQIGTRLTFSFGTELTSELRAGARRERTLLSILVLTAYAVVLSRWCLQQDFIIVFISHGRYGRQGLDNMIGFLAHDMYLRAKVAPNDTLRDVLRRLQSELSAAYANMDFDRAAALLPGCNREPLFNWQNTHGIREPIDQTWTPGESLVLQRFALRDVWPARFSPAFYDTGADIQGIVYFRSDLFSTSTLQAFADNLKLTAAQLARHSSASVESLGLTFGKERPLIAPPLTVQQGIRS